MGAQEPSGSRRLLLAMALASGITSVPNAAIVLALPTIHRHFDASLTELEWTVTGYLLAYSALLIAAGRLADVFGRVRLLQWGTVLYAAASVPAALAGSATVLIVGLVAVVFRDRPGDRRRIHAGALLALDSLAQRDRRRADPDRRARHQGII